MRIDCKFYESRTYASGETVRMCRMDAAPEAPWRCPENCELFTRKLSDGGWTRGSLVPNATDEPPPLDDHMISLLDEAENIVNAVGPDVIAAVQEEKAARQPRNGGRKRRWWWPFG